MKKFTIESHINQIKATREGIERMLNVGEKDATLTQMERNNLNLVF